jgi:inosine-uridine nucleoside N-ribohydrolase
MSVLINGTNPESGSAVARASGDTFIIHNPRGRMYLTVEEIFSGSPSTVSVTIQGQMASGTVDTVLDTNTSTSASLRSPSITKPYTAFLVTVTWTGGTNVKATFNWQFGGTA